jgi:hypothetical protein
MPETDWLEAVAKDSGKGIEPDWPVCNQTGFGQPFANPGLTSCSTIAVVGFMKRQGRGPIQPKETSAGLQLTEAVNRHPDKKCGVVKGVDDR